MHMYVQIYIFGFKDTFCFLRTFCLTSLNPLLYTYVFTLHHNFFYVIIFAHSISLQENLCSNRAFAPVAVSQTWLKNFQGKYYFRPSIFDTKKEEWVVYVIYIHLYIPMYIIQVCKYIKALYIFKQCKD